MTVFFMKCKAKLMTVHIWIAEHSKWLVSIWNATLGWNGLIWQKHPDRDVLIKRCSENMQQIYMRMSMWKCNFNKVALQLYGNHTSAWGVICWRFIIFIVCHLPVIKRKLWKKSSSGKRYCVGNEAKGRISKWVLQENKARQIFRKSNISYPLIHTRTRAYQGVRNVRFSENLACFVFLKHPLLDSPFCLITVYCEKFKWHANQ